MQKYYRVLQTRNQEKHLATNLSLTARGLSPMTPFVDAPDKFQYKWINLDSARLKASMTLDESMAITVLPPIIQAAKEGNTDLINELVSSGKKYCFLKNMFMQCNFKYRRFSFIIYIIVMKT